MGALNADADEAIIQLALLDCRMYRALLDRLAAGVCMVDRDHRILYWNGGAERISGYLAHEVAGQFSHGDLLLHCENDGSPLPGQPSAFPGAILDGKQRDCTVLLRHREGHRVLVHFQSRPIQDANGTMVGALEVFEEAPARRINRRSQQETFGCSDSSLRAANRHYGEMMLRHALEALNAFEIPFGWLRVGLDGAPDLDRGYGHGMVDAAVKMIAAALDGNLAPVDVLTRWEPGEFQVEIGGCSRGELASAAERLRLLVRASSLEWWGDRLGLTVSIGGATAEPGDTIASLEERVAPVYEGCLASGGDRSAVAHLVGSQPAGNEVTGGGAEPCLP
jgi:diguanylate cyclase (GGDEF)-like protein/PAS domain S-box-containing protein